MLRSKVDKHIGDKKHIGDCDWHCPYYYTTVTMTATGQAVGRVQTCLGVFRVIIVDGKTIPQTHTMIIIIVEADSMFRDFNISNIRGSVYNAISRERVL